MCGIKSCDYGIKTHLNWSDGVGLGPRSVLLSRSRIQFSLVLILVG